ncbi:prepilin-type N-terminal cleavage/methylation domain-containing protein [Balnearium lithotrophicum]|uniref:Prepilin-type N-terminal cleavage/methylation domain-containing protein n=1 Tax=Balnearium lithotrophicum TaxID=223788 RepID=A0A521CYH3_9BACT|nr:prepilin-type N-terminal cleavage/methylation domain-containing protein [Balnearium lithotrophicum]SMO64506.1 prepilin-type N-terminal cleavage/methylation domain-containing protein [Balnearium lithotrophicum]
MKRGFTLIELVITIVILSVLLSFAIPKFQKWKRKEEVKRDINYLYSVLQKTRNKAFLTKEDYTVIVNGTNVTIKNSQTLSIKLDTPFYSKRGKPVVLKVTSRGTFSKKTSIKCFNCNNLNLPYNCIVVNYYNLRMTRCD